MLLLVFLELLGYMRLHTEVPRLIPGRDNVALRAQGVVINAANTTPPQHNKCNVDISPIEVDLVRYSNSYLVNI